MYISEEGMKHILSIFDPNDPHKNILWTTNYKMELPLRIRKYGSGSEVPITLPEQFKIDCTLFAK